MKKQIVLGLGLAVIAAPALASKARLQALGEDTYGSFYINDNRNIFLNAAHLNNHKDLVTFEMGSETGDSDVDSSSAPRPEGGVFFGHGNLVYGVHLGSESNTSNGLRNWANVSTEQNNIDLFVAGDAGVKWGANLTYGHVTEGEDVNHSQVMRSRFGVIAGDLEAFANISLKNEAEQKDGSELEGKLGFQVGATYTLNAYKIFGEYRSIKAEDKSGNALAGNDSADAEISKYRIGAGRFNKLNDKATLFTKLEYVRDFANLEVGGGALDGGGDPVFYDGAPLTTGGEDLIVKNVPLTLGLEYDAASWLVLRGSIAQSLWSDVSLKDNSNSNLESTTVVNAGATLKFGELSLDGVVGNTDGANAVADQGTNGSLRTDNLMSRVSMTYRF
jgi:hypothetical protein